MSNTIVIAIEVVLIPLMFLISYYDTRYRRIPNAFVVGTLISGLAINTICFGWTGLGDSLLGCLLAFGLMFAVRMFTGLGAGDVKLFGAIGALIGVHQVLPAFLIVVILGGVLSAFAMIRAGTARQTMIGVYQILTGLLPGRELPSRDAFSRSGVTIPYGVAITCGSVLSIFSVLARS
ncbi:MAG: A24 family peptidase [Acidobacteriota bacterium]